MTDERARRIRKTRNRVKSNAEETDETDDQPDEPEPTAETDTQTSSNTGSKEASAASAEPPDAIAATEQPPTGGAVPSISSGLGESPTVDESALTEETMSGEMPTMAGATGREESVFADGNTLITTAHDDDETVQVLEFFLTGDRYAITIDRISAIVKMKEITRFPRGPDAIDGVTDLRGEITAVVDLTKLLNVDQCDPSPDHYIVVLEQEDDDKQKLGLRVTNVSHAVTYHESQIEESNTAAGITGTDHNLVRGIIKKSGDDSTSLIAWLDVDEIRPMLE